jgi:hypothetical protein
MGNATDSRELSRQRQQNPVDSGELGGGRQWGGAQADRNAEGGDGEAHRLMA